MGAVSALLGGLDVHLERAEKAIRDVDVRGGVIVNHLDAEFTGPAVVVAIDGELLHLFDQPPKLFDLLSEGLELEFCAEFRVRCHLCHSEDGHR